MTSYQTPSVPDHSLYHSTCLRRKLCIPFSDISNFSRVEDHLRQAVSNDMDGRCIAEGFIKPGSCRLRSYSIGTFSAGNIRFDLDIDCMLCCPKEGAIINCIAKTVTQAGIRAHACTNPSPVVIYISREMHDAARIHGPMTMDSIKPGDMMHVRVVGRRFELNDPQVSIIGELIND
jgi:hypothetical protein